MRNKKIIWSLIAAVIIVGGVLWWNQNAGPAAGEVVKVGVIVPLSGESAVFGEKFRNGIEIARQGFPADRLEIIYEDSRGVEAKGAITAYYKLVSADKVDLIFGPFGPEQTLALAPLAEESGLPIFAFSLCDPRFAEYKVVFCSFPSTEDTIKTGLDKIKELGLKRIYSVTHQAEPGLVFEEVIKSSQTSYGYEIVGADKISITDYDYRTAITKLKQAKPDAVYLYLFPEPGHIFLTQLKQLQFKNGVVFASLDTTEERLQSLGDVAEGVYFPGFLPTDYESSFQTQYQNRYNSEPDLYAALGQSVAMTVFETLTDNRWNKNKLLDSTPDFQSPKAALGGFHFKSDHTVSIPQSVFIFRDGKFGELT
ncbi:MAG: ABC transporter substrate-binding protein [Candidatus Vogelbacteria bacterium]|nr:ABC transporter substrate-binding protein [Candidatus Vogelbacteria bacterium]